MVRNSAKYFVCLLIGFFSIQFSFGQEVNFQGINVQGELNRSEESTIDLAFEIIDLSGAIVWDETHFGVSLSNGMFAVVLGEGDYVGGAIADFSTINWLMINRVILYEILDGDRVELSDYNMKNVPYAFHSLHTLVPNAVSDLTDYSGGTPEVGWLLKYEDGSYVASASGDSALFAYYTYSASYVDTASYGFNISNADSATFTSYADSVNYAAGVLNSDGSDAASFVDSAAYVFSSIGNWSISGDSLLTADNFVGTVNEQRFAFGTNSSSRLSFSSSGDITNDISFSPGFSINPSKKGELFNFTTTGSDISDFTDSYFYFEGSTSSFHGGSSEGNKDSLKGANSFSWGRNVGTNGSFSTVFGYNTYGDSSSIAGGFPAMSSFAVGRDCRVARTGVAIGYNVQANFYRNVGVGKDIISGVNSSTYAMGNNVVVTGATSWATGRNLTVESPFSIVLGENANTLSNSGTFLYGDNSTEDTVFSTAINQFMVRADGGIIFYSSSDLSMGVELASGGGSWNMISDRNKKMNILSLDYNKKELFDQIAIYNWRYKGQQTEHIGPMAQDFKATFGVGERSTYINMLDADGIVFLGTKMLLERLKKVPTNEEVQDLKHSIKEEEKELNEIRNRVNSLLHEELDH